MRSRKAVPTEPGDTIEQLAHGVVREEGPVAPCRWRCQANRPLERYKQRYEVEPKKWPTLLVEGAP